MADGEEGWRAFVAWCGAGEVFSSGVSWLFRGRVGGRLVSGERGLLPFALDAAQERMRCI